MLEMALCWNTYDECACHFLQPSQSMAFRTPNGENLKMFGAAGTTPGSQVTTQSDQSCARSHLLEKIHVLQIGLERRQIANRSSKPRGREVILFTDSKIRATWATLICKCRVFRNVTTNPPKFFLREGECRVGFVQLKPLQKRIFLGDTSSAFRFEAQMRPKDGSTNEEGP